ncbi:class I SAM-dependent methyltransferase [Oscillospiraceae bacterium HV4-5-C5C]|nr:class I SAM-dependent methyltransferase [Oscillospiraceae bacterium HV4-5-C5C]
MTQQYFTTDPTVPSRPITYQLSAEGRQFAFHSDRGVFSGHSLDFGSDLLLQTVIADLRKGRPQAAGSLLDLGCGIGVLGVVLKRLFPQLELTLSDVNHRALALTRQNLAENGIRYAEVVDSDGWQNLTGRRFDLIVTNPPIRAGKAVVYDFFDGAAAALNPGGTLYVVIGKKQGAPSARRKLEETFGRCDCLARDKGFFVYSCPKPD